MARTLRFLTATVILIPVLAWYLGTPPNGLQTTILSRTAWILIGAIGLTFVVGQATGNHSQVDKLWSILPAVYAWDMTAQGGWNARMVLMSVLVTAWAVRLTYNFARRGGYSWRFWEGEEDYRWGVLRQRPGFRHPLVWTLFNLLFICTYQNLLIFLFTLPILSPLGTGADDGLRSADIVLSLLFLCLLALEYIADQQQYDFQTEKHRRLRAGEEPGPYADGFVQTGLWAFVRHPNYAAEQGIWIVFYLFSVAATGEWLNWTVAGCVLLVILFRGSSDFSEEISAGKYPAYRDYMNRTGRFLPRWRKA